MARAAKGGARPLRVGGLTPLSASDWPGQLAAVVFCQGCPWRCGYCQNPHLLPARAATELAWRDVLAFLRRRIGLLDAVVFSGGEPLAQRALGAAARAVRRLGFKVGLHTAGAYPERFADVLPLLDWVGFDVKAPFPDYVRVTGVPGSGEKALASARLLLESGTAHEFRTTVHPRLLGHASLERLAEQLVELGVHRYAVQEFRAQGCTDMTLVRNLPPTFLTGACAAELANRFESFTLRRA